MLIELVTEETFEAVLPLIAAYQRFYESAPDESRNREFFGKLLETPDKGVQLVALDGAQPCGFATLYFPLSSVSASAKCLMNDLYVVPETRGRGVGTALIVRCLKWAGEHGYAELYWQTQKDNETAQRLYQKMNAFRSEWYTYTLPVMRLSVTDP